MDKSDLEEAFRLLGERIKKPLQIVLGGGSALLITGLVGRGTKDADVIKSSNPISGFKKEIAEVAGILGIKEDWLNDDAQAWSYLLPEDFQERLASLETFGMLRVGVLGRREIMLMKVAAGRPIDFQDVERLIPTDEDLQWLKDQAVRIHRIDAGDAMMINDYVDVFLGQRETAREKAKNPRPGRGASK